MTPRKLVKNSKAAASKENQTLNPEEKSAKADDVINDDETHSKPARGRGRPKKYAPDVGIKVSTASKDAKAAIK